MAHATRLFVGNLPDNLNEIALREAFSSFGEITNFDLKSKPGIDNEKKKFAFISISGSNLNIESCIKHFSNEDFQGTKLHVTRARESFLERLQREREQSNKNGIQQDKYLHKEAEIIHKNNTINETQTLNKRKFIDETENTSYKITPKEIISDKFIAPVKQENMRSLFYNDEKKQNSDKKRLESIKKKIQEFNEKKNIVKSGLISIDKKLNKKIVFSDAEEQSVEDNVLLNGHNKDANKANLFEDEDSDQDINFEIKEQFEGKKGQKVLDLQSRYKSDKRFVLDERFAEDSGSDKEPAEDENVDLEQADQKSKQLNILQDVLGFPIKTRSNETTNKTKAKLGMLRFDPFHPEHAKYLAPVTAKESTKKPKVKKPKDNEYIEETQKLELEIEKVEVSKEQFYKISDNLKEVISQPTGFSLRSLFTKDHDQEEEKKLEQDYTPIVNKKDSKVRNPMDPGEKNPFVYDSSESENEEEIQNNEGVNESRIIQNDSKTVWREKLFFSSNDYRLKEGLLFFGKINECNKPKERRELKSLMKKRIYNKERKNTMFQKKIGGRKKSVKKFRKN